jgi:nicotinamidase/pyrazinamidase
MARPALLIVDVQRDFCPGGALPAAGADLILAALNQHIKQARERGLPIYASRDWHPEITNHFKAYGGPWPVHCVQNSEGASFHPELKLPPNAIVVSKGDDPERPGYSAFEGKTYEGRMLLDDLRRRGVDCVYVAGLTTEYCVKQTVLDARKAGLRVNVLIDAIAPIEAQPGDADRAMAEMKAAGAELNDVLVP